MPIHNIIFNLYMTRQNGISHVELHPVYTGTTFEGVVIWQI